MDNALRIATMLQLEGPLTVTAIAERLGVATSTAHRLLAMLVYRDFAVQDANRAYRVGPVLELAAHSQSAASRLRAAALPHLHRLVDVLDESANVAVRTGRTVRFIASVESTQALRVTSRDGMVFAAHQTTTGLLSLAAMPSADVAALYAVEDGAAPDMERPDLKALHAELASVRRKGFAVNHGKSERGVVAVGVPIHSPAGEVVAGLAASIPSVRYEKMRLPGLVTLLRSAASELEADLAEPR